VGLGKSNLNTKGAISEHLFKVILAVESKSLVVPKDLHPHNVNNILDKNDLHSWLLAINQYYIKNNNVAPELIIETSKTIIEAAGDKSEQADFVRKSCGQLKILEAFDVKNDTKLNKEDNSTITIKDFKKISHENLNVNLNDETLELIFFVFGIPMNEDTELDFLLFARLFYLILNKKSNVENELNEFRDNNMEITHSEDDKMNEIHSLSEDISNNNIKACSELKDDNDPSEYDDNDEE
jgi:hypothetical protein